MPLPAVGRALEPAPPPDAPEGMSLLQAETDNTEMKHDQPSEERRLILTRVG
jgi:hypothetical protein